MPFSDISALSHPKRPLRVAMLCYCFYEVDNRVRRYAETLVRRGDTVDVISLRRNGQSHYEELNGVRIFKVQERVRDEKGRLDYLRRIIKFVLKSAFLLTRKHLSLPYDLIHVHSVPDFEVFAAIMPKLSGAPVILDIHDIVPELYASKFKLRKNSVAFKFLVLLEKASIAFSDHVIISNDLWRKRLISRSVSREKCTAILNYPDDRLFHRSGRLNKNGERIVLMYPGTLNHHQGLDIAINAFSTINHKLPNAKLIIYGEGPAKECLADLIRKYGLEKQVFLYNQVPLHEIARIMAEADIGVIPKRNDDFGGEAFSTKSLEFMILGVPIIVSRTLVDQFYFNESIVKFFDPGNVENLAAVMLEMAQDKVLRDRLSAGGIEFLKKNSWSAKENMYLDIVESLVVK